MQGRKCRNCVLGCKEAQKKNRNSSILVEQKIFFQKFYTAGVRNYDRKSSGKPGSGNCSEFLTFWKIPLGSFAVKGAK
ncbi:hypothetical protein TNCV_2276521 [Trichonephila clavipes]|nr:hypothetical protein TNCV_2276521 [Trichonephila clavipes]